MIAWLAFCDVFQQDKSGSRERGMSNDGIVVDLIRYRMTASAMNSDDTLSIEVVVKELLSSVRELMLYVRL